MFPFGFNFNGIAFLRHFSYFECCIARGKKFRPGCPFNRVNATPSEVPLPFTPTVPYECPLATISGFHPLQQDRDTVSYISNVSIFLGYDKYF